MFPRLSAQRIRQRPGSVVKPCSSQGDYEELQNINITIDTYRERNFVKLRERGREFSVHIYIYVIFMIMHISHFPFNLSVND